MNKTLDKVTRRSDKDAKGRKLYKGESQREDGRYEFRYTDANGKRKSVYSWKLTPTDPTPQGKKRGPSLRELKMQIEADVRDGISDANMTVDALWKKFIVSKTDLKDSTRNGYTYNYNKYIKPEFGNTRISAVKHSDILGFYGCLIRDVGLTVRTVEIIHNILHPMFNLAVKDHSIRDNPAHEAMKDLKKNNNSKEKEVHTLTKEEQEIFFDFVENSDTYSHWLDLFIVMLGTGCRIGEILGLTFADLDFKNNNININHSISYRPQEDGKCKHRISTPKTKKGTRNIPMLPEVKEALLRVKADQKLNGRCESVVDGYSGFVFMNRDKKVMMFSSVNKAIARIVKEQNKQASEDKSVENPVMLTHFTAHSFRHTFCTRLFEKSQDFKAIQELMGHADVQTTMNIYDKVFPDRRNQVITNLTGMIKTNKNIKKVEAN